MVQPIVHLQFCKEYTDEPLFDVARPPIVLSSLLKTALCLASGTIAIPPQTERAQRSPPHPLPKPPNCVLIGERHA